MTNEQLTSTSLVAASSVPLVALGTATRPSQRSFHADSNSSSGSSLTG